MSNSPDRYFGRPTWITEDGRCELMETYEAIKRAAEDRCYWRACTAACQPSELEDDS